MQRKLFVNLFVSIVLGLLAVLPFRTQIAAFARQQAFGRDGRNANDIRLRKVQEVYQSLVAPTAAQVMAGQHSVAHLFDLSSVRGRVYTVPVS